MTAPPIAFNDLAQGDEVTLFAKVDYRTGSKVQVHVTGSGGSILVGLDAIATHTPKPRPLAPGDMVTTQSHPATLGHGVIIAIHRGVVWVDWGSEYQMSSRALDTLERAQ